jgi:hypothetical protein
MPACRRAVIRRALGPLVTALVLIVPAPAGARVSYHLSGSPTLDSVLNGPWNTSQGDSSAGSAYQLSDLFGTYTPGGNTTTLGGVTEPNLAVYPSASGTVPYPSGVAGTPGPLDGYCSSLGANPESGVNVPEPANTGLPMAPYYFPYVVRNADGSLTGYFDWRPKDADEAITVARSTDNGLSWQTEGQALEQNTGYCPTADTNDDGQGHPFAMTVGRNSYMYTLQRAVGDYTGTGLLVHRVSPRASDPLGGLPATEPVGVDPNTFAVRATSVPTTGGSSIRVSTLGTSGSPDSIVAGPYEDADAANPSGSVITCTGTQTAPVELTGCTVAGGSPLAISPGDDLVQVIATLDATNSTSTTIPASSSQNPAGSGGLKNLALNLGAEGYPDTTANSPTLTYIMNLNAPNRVYVGGHAVYCVQGNANPTSKLENCSSPTGPFTFSQGDPVTADPVVPSTAAMTTGLVAPDGIIGTLPWQPRFNGARVPQGATITLYTEKILNYFLEGQVNGSVSAGTYAPGDVTLPASTINYSPFPTTSEPLPSSGSFTTYLGTSGSSAVQAVTCTGVAPASEAQVPPGSEDLTGCSGGTGTVGGSGATDTSTGKGTGYWIGAPGAALAPYAALGQIDEGKNGKTSGPEKLFGNNEDLTVLRAAYTTDGVAFHDLGVISGTSSGTGNDSGDYTDVSNPLQQDSPDSSADPTTATMNPTGPTNLAPGSSDQIELRFVGSRGTIIRNPDGSLGMFLSGAWASDGDSDAFNQIFYTSSIDGGQRWSVPQVVLSTDYSFADSAAQDAALAGGTDSPLAIGAYYSGRAYGPAVVANRNGTLTMVFSGYRLPKPIESAGTSLGTNPAAPYVVGATDPALYRDILTATLYPGRAGGCQRPSGWGCSRRHASKTHRARSRPH